MMRKSNGRARSRLSRWSTNRGHGDAPQGFSVPFDVRTVLAEMIRASLRCAFVSLGCQDTIGRHLTNWFAWVKLFAAHFGSGWASLPNKIKPWLVYVYLLVS